MRRNPFHLRMIPISFKKNDNDVIGIWYNRPPRPISSWSVNTKVFKNVKFWWFYFRAYPSLKLRINVNAARNEVDVVMPGLRYDDIDFTGNVCGQQEKLHIAIYKIHSIKQFENE